MSSHTGLAKPVVARDRWNLALDAQQAIHRDLRRTNGILDGEYRVVRDLNELTDQREIARRFVRGMDDW